MANKYNDRRSGPEGSFWWYDWLGNLDDRAEIRAHGSTYPTYADAMASVEVNSRNAGITANAAGNESALVAIGLSSNSWNVGEAEPTLNIPQWYFYAYSHHHAADGGAAFLDATARAHGESADPYAVQLGYWKCNTSAELGGNASAQTNYGGEGQVWQTFNTDISAPELRRPAGFAGQSRIFGVRYDNNELTGFRNRFGAPTADTYISIMDDVITSIASGIEVTTLSSQPIFNEIVLDKGFDYSKRSFLSTEEEEQAGIQSSLSFVSASAPTNGNGSGGY
tara:strand:+ start:668 stop:1507 length:840 start_codon:yes stop_codon:yes gene_type:complete